LAYYSVNLKSFKGQDMELSWLMRIRIIASLAIGAVLLGFLPWNLVRPDAGGVFALLSGSISISDLLICTGLAFIAGFLSSAICTPYGAQIGIIAAPAGLAVWGLKSAPLSKFFQMAPAVQDRIQVYSKLKFEGFIWLAIAVCGFLGAITADKIFGSTGLATGRRKAIELPDEIKPAFRLPEFAQIVISVIGTVFVANFLINIFAANISYSDSELGSVTAQPANLQMVFAVFIAFGLCGFFAKFFLAAKAFWPAIASVPLIYYSAITYGKNDILVHLVASWPAVFFARPVMAVLPVQMVAFGCLGAVWGYWLAVNYHLWRTHQE
jgi:hypothetical protein